MYNTYIFPVEYLNFALIALFLLSLIHNYNLKYFLLIITNILFLRVKRVGSFKLLKKGLNVWTDKMRDALERLRHGNHFHVLKLGHIERISRGKLRASN